MFEVLLFESSSNTVGLESIMIGLAKDRMSAFDSAFADALQNGLKRTGDLVSKPLDLAVINMRRGRDHGIPAYKAIRRFYKIFVNATSANINDIMNPWSYNTLKSIYQ
jgi:hypothetical protein